MPIADRSLPPPPSPMTGTTGRRLPPTGSAAGMCLWLLLYLILVLAATGALAGDGSARATVVVQSVQASNDTPTAADNDYTRINNAIQAAEPGMVIELDGEFDWTEAQAMASWELGSNGVADGEVLVTGGDDWSIRLPDNVHEVTVRASPNGAVIQGFPGRPEDGYLAETAFLVAYGSNHGWTFQGLTVRGFNMGITMFRRAGTTAVFNDTTFIGNRIEVGPETGDPYASYGLFANHGSNQQLIDNEIIIDIDGVDASLGSAADFRIVGVQIGDSSNSAVFDGLVVSGNRITVVGEPAGQAPEVIGVWENAGDANSAITIQDNHFTGSGDLGEGVGNNQQTAFIASTQSAPGRTSLFGGNTVTGAAVALRSQRGDYRHYVPGSAPLLIEGNTLVGNGTALHLPAGYPNPGQYTIRHNRIAGNALGVFAALADGSNEQPSLIALDDNWWGCNAGPGEPGCDAVLIEGAEASDPAAAQVALDSWLALSALADPPVLAAAGDSAALSAALLPFDGTTLSELPAAAFPPTAIDLVTGKGSFAPAPDVVQALQAETAAGLASATLYQLESGYAALVAGLDNQLAEFHVRVDGPVTVNDNVEAAETLPAGATCGAPDFSTIQDALDAMPAGATILVCPGSYAEELSISRPVTLLGAGHGVDGRSRNTDDSDAGESVLLPPQTHPDIALDAYFAGWLVSVDAPDVVIDGFVLDGDNPDLASGVDLNGADIDYSAGLLAYGTTERFQLRNNIIRNMQSAGIYGYGHLGDNVIQFNRFANMPAPSAWGVGVLTTNHWYVQVRDNLFDTVRIGVQSNLLSLANPGSQPPAISDNEFRVQHLGVFLNQNGGAVATSHQVQGNLFQAVPAAGLESPWTAVLLQGLTGSRRIGLEDNHIDGSGVGRTRIGYLLSNIATSAAPETRFIAGGSVSNVDVGVLATDAHFYRGTVNDFIVRGISFANVGHALLVEDTEADGQARLSLGAGNDFSGAGWAVTLSGPQATLGAVDGLSGAETVRVRAARAANTWGRPDFQSLTHAVAPGSINHGIAAVQEDGSVLVEAGLFEQAVTVNRRVQLLGAQAFVSARDAVAPRAGGESIIAPDARARVSLRAAGARLDGFTLTGTSSDPVTASAAVNVTASDVAVVNNRVLDLNGNGVYLSRSDTVGVLVQDNHFGQLHGGNYNGVKTEGSTGLQVIGNSFGSIDYQGVQLGGVNHGAQVLDNTIHDTVHGGINIGGGSGITVTGNVLDAADTNGGATRAAIRLYPGVDAVVACNAILGSNQQGIYFRQGSGLPMARVHHNQILAGVALVTDLPAETAVGSNWYGGAATVGGTQAQQLRVADPLPGNPLAHPECGDNTAVAHVLVSGSGQSALLGSGFATPLASRLVDALGGAVVGEPVTVSAPAAGASAQLDPGPGIRHSDYNGMVRSTATANQFAGSYAVSASSGVGEVAFELTNQALAQVALDLNGPVTGVQVGEAALYTGTLVNESAPVSEEVLIRLAVIGADSPAAVDMCLQLGGDCLPVLWTEAGGTLIAEVPGDVAGSPVASYPIAAPFNLTHLFNVTYGHAGTFVASAEVVGAQSATVYAADVIATEVIDEHDGVTLDLSGPVAGVEKGSPTLYQARLASEVDVADNVLVGFVLTRDGGIEQGDLTVEYDAGGGNFLPLALNDVGGQLVGSFGPAGGFPLLQGHDATTLLRVTYHTTPPAPGMYQVQAMVVDAAGDSDGVAVYAGDHLATQVVDAAPDVELVLSGPFNSHDQGLLSPRVGDPLLIRGDLANHGGSVADLVQARFTVGAGFVLSPDDLVVRYWFLADPAQLCDIGAATGLVQVAADEFTAGPGGLSITTPAHALGEGFELAACVEIEPARAGAYAIGAVIEDADGDSDGLASYAADHLAVPVARGQATLDWDPDSLGSFDYSGSPREAVVLTSPAGLEDSVVITYNGAPDAPVAVGNYLVLATLVDDDYQADPITGSIVIGADSVQITDIGFAEGGTSLVFDGTDRAIGFSAEPAPGTEGIACAVTANGGTALPNAAGSYLVTVTCEGPNHFGAASQTLAITPAQVLVSFDNLVHSYDGAVKSASVSTTPSGVAGIGLAYQPALPVAAGSYQVDAVLDNPNYQLAGSTSATLVIHPAAAAVVLSDLVQVYDGSPRPVTVATVPAGLPVAVDYGGGGVPTQVGIYPVTATIADANHAGSASGVLQILPADAQALALTVNGGASATAEVATVAAYSFVATVQDEHGHPVPGVAVAFSSQGAGAGISPAQAVVPTDASGQAVFTADANTVAGSFTVSASAAGLVPASVGLVNTAAGASTLLLVSGSPQSASVNSAFDDLVVRVADTYGNPVAGVAVGFQAGVDSGGASAVLDPASGQVSSDTDGLAVIAASANAIAGNYTVTATADGLDDPVSFALANLAGEAAVLVKVEGDGQVANAGSPVAVAPQVRVEDDSGNPVDGAIVSFTVASGGGSVGDATVMTDADGLARVGSWTLGMAAGENTLAASVVGAAVTPVTFTATAHAQVDAAISVTAIGDYTRVGALHEHLVLVRNDGLSTATSVAIDVPLPDSHDAGSARWLCLASGGASCPAASGQGLLSAVVALPAGGSLTFLTSATVAAAPADELITLTADVQSLVEDDVEPGNDSAAATTQVVLFRNGFEPGGDGVHADDDGLIDGVAGELRRQGPALSLPAAGADTGPLPLTWLRLETAAGQLVARVEQLRHAGSSWLRLRGVAGSGDSAGAWLPAAEGIQLALATRDGVPVLRLAAGAQHDELPLAGDIRTGLLVLSVGS